MNWEELITRYKAGERDFSGVDLREPEFAGLDLTTVSPVYGGYNRTPNMKNISLEGINLKGATIYGANLDYINLKGADLSEAFLRNTGFLHANLTDVNFENSDCKNNDFRWAKLAGANFRGANFVNAELADSGIYGANLESANLQGAIIKRADLPPNLRETDLRYAMLSDVNLRKSNFTRVNFSEAKLSFVDFEDSNLSHVNFSGAIITAVNFRGVELSTVNLTDVKHRGNSLVLTTFSSNTSDITIVKRLEQNSKIIFSSESGEYEFSFFLWEVDDREEITIKDLLEWGQYDAKTQDQVHSLSKCFPPEDIAVYEKNLTDTKVYLIEEGERELYYLDVYVIGQTPTGNFAGYYAQTFWYLKDMRYS